MTATTFALKNYQRELFPFAYNILGVVEDAEDVVQEVMINWQKIDKAQVDNERAYLIKSVVNRAINEKQKSSRQRESYIGQWLPEPVFTENYESNIDSASILNYSMLVMLEQLNAKERAVLVLRESYDYKYSEIAALLSLSQDNCRQLLRRAKSKLSPIAVDAKKWDGATEQIELFIKAVRTGNIAAVERMLADDVALISDSNGTATAARNILEGVARVRKFLIGIFSKPVNFEVEIKFAMLNHEPALLFYSNGKLIRCKMLHINSAGKLQGLYFILNLDKLKAINKLTNLSQNY